MQTCVEHFRQKRRHDKLTRIEWIGGWIRRVSRMTPSSTGKSRISSYSISRSVPSLVLKWESCSSHSCCLNYGTNELWEPSVRRATIPDVGTGSKMQKDPRACCRTGVLASHQQCNHNVCDFTVTQCSPVFVLAFVHEGAKHVQLTLQNECWMCPIRMHRRQGAPYDRFLFVPELCLHKSRSSFSEHGLVECSSAVAVQARAS